MKRTEAVFLSFSCADFAFQGLGAPLVGHFGFRHNRQGFLPRIYTATLGAWQLVQAFANGLTVPVCGSGYAVLHLPLK